jgi:hypothetical protein
MLHFFKKLYVSRYHTDKLALFQADQTYPIDRSSRVPVNPGPAGMESVMAACFPTPVDDQGDALLLNFAPAGGGMAAAILLTWPHHRQPGCVCCYCQRCLTHFNRLLRL